MKTSTSRNRTSIDATSIALFQRIFGEHQEPAKGFQLDTVGTRPTAYARGTQMSDFEKKIWDDFWLIANDNKRAQELGIDAIQGKAVAIRAQPGKSYEIKLRSTGDMTIRPIESKAPPARRPAQLEARRSGKLDRVLFVLAKIVGVTGREGIVWFRLLGR